MTDFLKIAYTRRLTGLPHGVLGAGITLSAIVTASVSMVELSYLHHHLEAVTCSRCGSCITGSFWKGRLKWQWDRAPYWYEAAVGIFWPQQCCKTALGLYAVRPIEISSRLELHWTLLDEDWFVLDSDVEKCWAPGITAENSIALWKKAQLFPGKGLRNDEALLILVLSLSPCDAHCKLMSSLLFSISKST